MSILSPEHIIQVCNKYLAPSREGPANITHDSKVTERNCYVALYSNCLAYFESSESEQPIGGIVLNAKSSVSEDGDKSIHISGEGGHIDLMPQGNTLKWVQALGEARSNNIRDLIDCLNDPSFVKQGFLQKKKKLGNKIRPWGRRFFRLYHQTLYYYKISTTTPPDIRTDPVGYIVLNGSRLEENPEQVKTFSIITSEDITYKFVADDQTTASSWIVALNQAIKDHNAAYDEDSSGTGLTHRISAAVAPDVHNEGTPTSNSLGPPSSPGSMKIGRWRRLTMTNRDKEDLEPAAIEALEAASDPEISGLLSKKKKKGLKFRTWQVRFCVLKKNKLYYFRNEGGEFLGMIVLDGCSVRDVSEVKENAIEIAMPDGTCYYFASDSETEAAEWGKALVTATLGKSSIFGGHLSDHLHVFKPGELSLRGCSPKVPTLIPSIVARSLEFIEKEGLDSEGIYRLSGSLSDINELRSLFDSPDVVNLKVFHQYAEANAVAGILKAYFRELAVPLFTFDLYDAFCEIGESNGTEEEAVAQLKELVTRLPRDHLDLTRILMFHLNLVSSHCDINMMGAENLALVVGPNLMRDKEEDAMSMVGSSGSVGCVVSTMIRHVESIFGADESGSKSEKEEKKEEIESPAPIVVEESQEDPTVEAEAEVDGEHEEEIVLFAVEALYDYEGEGEKEISFKAGQLITVNQQKDEWWLGTINDTGEMGWFPASFVSVKMTNE